MNKTEIKIDKQEIDFFIQLITKVPPCPRLLLHEKCLNYGNIKEQLQIMLNYSPGNCSI